MPPRTVTHKWQCFQLYVLPSPATVPPKEDAEPRFYQAGLGMTMVSLPEEDNQVRCSSVSSQTITMLYISHTFGSSFL